MLCTDSAHGMVVDTQATGEVRAQEDATMPTKDTKQREKGPAPRPYPDPAEAEAEIERAQEEAATDPLRAKTRAVLALLRLEYGEPEWPILDPLETLIEVLLSHRTADPQTWAAFNELKARFSSWEEVRDAPVK